MKIKTLLRTFVQFSLSALLVITLFSSHFLGGVAATPFPDSKTKDQLLEPEVPTNIDIFYSLADADITSGFPTENTGTIHNFVVGYHDIAPSGISRGLIYFNITSLPSNQNIMGATLRIYHDLLYGGVDQKITSYRITSSWAEGTVTWNNKPDYGESYGYQIIPGGWDGWYEIDVTDLVRGWYDGTYSNYGVMLRGVESDGIGAQYRMFLSRESELDPELIIQYESNPVAPTISGLPDQELLVDTNLNNVIDLWAYANDAEDADSALSFSINNTPNSSAGVSIDSNRYIDIYPSAGWTGTTNVEIKVTDTDGLSATDSFQVEVTGGASNTPPTIAGLPDRDLPVNTNFNNAIDLWAYASDVEDSDSELIFTINNTPNSSAGVSIDSNRYIDINPTPGWTGVTVVSIEVMDTGGKSDLDSFEVEVIGGSSNSPPTISGLPDKQLPINTSQDNAIDLWAYASDAEDADSALSYSINNNPNPSAGVSIDSNRYIDINPTPGWVGVTNVSIEVMDTGSLSDLDSFQIEITSGNGTSPPTISGLPDKELLVNTSQNNAIDLWAYANDVEDADAALSFTINNNPNPSAGVSIESNRYIDINPSVGWIGVTNVSIEVMDTDSYSDLDSFQVRVYGEIEVINLPIIQRNYSFTSHQSPLRMNPAE